jgi:hypothetical protein
MAATPPPTDSNRTLLLDSLPNLAPLVRPIANPTIGLTPLEEQICTLLDECTRKLRQSQPELEPVECRIAGGWVRDKVRRP